MKYIVICNGKPGSGKTTFQKRCIEYLNESDLAYGHIHSSIDYIKGIYRQLGWDGTKTDKARKDLSILKKMWIETCDGPLENMIEYIIRLDKDSDHVVFVDIREESEIIKFKEVFNALRPIGIKCTTMLIEREDYNGGLEYGNKSDDNVGKNMSLYECVIYNRYTVSTLYDLADAFIDQLLEEE